MSNEREFFHHWAGAVVSFILLRRFWRPALRNLTRVHMRAAIGIFSLAVMVAACGPVMEELPDETKVVRPVLEPAESEELIRLLNSRRKNWDRLMYTAPAHATAVIELSSPTGMNTIIYFYAQSSAGRCTLIGWHGEFRGSQSFPAGHCERLAAILAENSAQ